MLRSGQALRSRSQYPDQKNDKRFCSGFLYHKGIYFNITPPEYSREIFWFSLFSLYTSNMFLEIPPSWQSVLPPEFCQQYWPDITEIIICEYSQKVCFPQEQDIFKAFSVTSFDKVKVVILGQDPYHTPGAAMWLAFSIPERSKMQPSLRNILRELESDLGFSRTRTDLTDWAEQWVLLMNSVLTVREWEPASHQGKGWEQFTDATIRVLSEQRIGIVFILWGNYAIAKQSLIDTTRHHIITSPHPSPFSAHRGFLGSRPFSRTNEYLRQSWKEEIDWS